MAHICVGYFVLDITMPLNQLPIKLHSSSNTSLLKGLPQYAMLAASWMLLQRQIKQLAVWICSDRATRRHHPYKQWSLGTYSIVHTHIYTHTCTCIQAFNCEKQTSMCTCTHSLHKLTTILCSLVKAFTQCQTSRCIIGY